MTHGLLYWKLPALFRPVLDVESSKLELVLARDREGRLQLLGIARLVNSNLFSSYTQHEFSTNLGSGPECVSG